MRAQDSKGEGATLGARETFEQAARAARRLAVVTAELQAMDDGWRRGGWPSDGRGSGHSDPTAGRAAYRMATTDRLRTEKAELAEIVAEARALTEGIQQLLGNAYADALAMRYLEGRQWQVVADSLGVCLKTAYNHVSVALDTIDALGRARVISGRGMADDQQGL